MRAGTPLTGAGFLGSRCVPFPVAGIRTPKSPLESGDACAPGTCGRGRPRALEMPACPARAHGSIQMQKGYVTAAAQCSQRKMPERVALTHHVSPRIHFVLEVLCAPGVSAVRFCSKVNHEKREAPHRRGLHGGAAQSITPRGLCACYQLLTSGTIRP
ncbi:hypothetical protein RoseRS_2410 [Roseiflexus sp. RS-1]|jgi:hypothetical protein|nr:hypothetical protein RoseRS_2410 [Roseiflexus sp. RS-1]